MNKKNKNILRNPGFQSFLSAIICIIFGIIVGYLVLLAISPANAANGILAILKNFLNFGFNKIGLKNFGSTLVHTAPLIMCSLSILFAYKVGFFNIGAAGQYVAGAASSLFCALYFHMNWFACIIIAMIVGAIWGAIPGLLKAYRNVNEVISGIMLNWIALYLTNSMISMVTDPTSQSYSLKLKDENPAAKLPSLGIEKLFTNNSNVTIAIPLAIIIAVVVWVVLEKTKLGYELKATGANKFAAIYCGMNEKKNTIMTLAISGALAGLGAAFNYLSGAEQWFTGQNSVPAMGFNGIASAFLGGLSPIGSIFSSYFIQHITDGAVGLDKRVYCSQVSDLMSAIIIYLCGFTLFFRIILNRALDRKEEKKLAKALEETSAKAEEEKGGEE